MALRDQPYLPLYIQDFLTDEKLIECSAQATGVYIRIMCLMHKSKDYGKILLKQKYKQSESKIEGFATLFAKSLPYTYEVILLGLHELLDENVLKMEGDFLVQKRMVEDNELSLIRSESGKNGAEVKKKNKENFAIAKVLANTEYEYEYIISIVQACIEPETDENKTVMVIVEMMKSWMKYKPEYSFMQEVDYPALLKVAYFIAERKGWKKASVVGEREKDTLQSWEKICKFISTKEADAYLKRLTIDGISVPKNFQKLEEAMKAGTMAKEERVAKLEEKRITPEQYFKD